MQDRTFLKSILPLSDELNEILGMIFELDPTKRIRIDELRQRIISCQQFTAKPAPVVDVCDVDFVEVDLDIYSPDLSPSSSTSEESAESMSSGSSTDSIFDAVLQSPSEDDLNFVNADDDYWAEEFLPAEPGEKGSDLENSYVAIDPYSCFSPVDTLGLHPFDVQSISVSVS